jgi:hypothetical protein
MTKLTLDWRWVVRLGLHDRKPRNDGLEKIRRKPTDAGHLLGGLPSRLNGTTGPIVRSATNGANGGRFLPRIARISPILASSIRDIGRIRDAV